MRKQEFLIVGLGPVGISVLSHLLRLGVQAEDITVVDPNIDFYQDSDLIFVGGDKPYTAYDALSNTNQANKNGKTKNFFGTGAVSPSFYWGASCLPNKNMGDQLGEKYLKYYGIISNLWNIQAELDISSEYYPITQETIGKLPRKSFAHQVVADQNNSNAVHLGHSRLAISEQCKLCDRCFVGCPNFIPWTPKKLFKLLVKQFPGLRLVNSQVISVEPGHQYNKVYFKNGQKYNYSIVLLSSGWQSTCKLFSSTFNLNFDTKDIEQSTVIMNLLKFPENKKITYSGSFSYHDLIAFDGEGEFFSQIYLPSPEISGRILSAVPFLNHILSAASTKFIEDRGLINMGVSMSFTEGSSWKLTKTQKYKQIIYNEFVLKKLLSPYNIKVLTLPVKVLDRGFSHHIGAWSYLKDKNELFYRNPKNLILFRNKHNNIVPLDSSILPRIDAGPHTAHSAANALGLVEMLIN